MRNPPGRPKGGSAVAAPAGAAAQRPAPAGACRGAHPEGAAADAAAALPGPDPRVPAWRALIDGLPDATWLVDARTQCVVADNAAARRLLAPPGGSLVGRAAGELLASIEDLAFWGEAAQGSAGALQSHTVLATPDGRTLQVARSIHALGADAAGAGLHYAVVVGDRSAERRLEDEREQALAELKATLESTAEGILVTDLGGRIRAFNRRFAQLWGMPEALLHAQQDDAVHEWMRTHLAEPPGADRRRRAPQPGGDARPGERLALLSGRVLERMERPLRCRGRTLGRVWSYRDLSEQLAVHRQLETAASTDPLTGLPNRRLLAERVARAGRQVRRQGGSFALLLIDLDRFHHVNDTLGHGIGDRVLADVAQRIAQCKRADDLLARVGGDQFALLVGGADAAAAEAAARRVLDAVAVPCRFDGAPFTLTCSIGGAVCPDDGHSADDLLRHAEAAVHAAKDGGRAGWRLHAERRGADRRADMQLDHAMRQALTAGRFRLHYQPQAAMDGTLVGAEALLRWRDPALGEVPPARFIPVAESSGFVVALGDWVLEHAVRQAAAWHALGHALPVAVNVSALQFRQPRFVERVAEVLAAGRLPPALLVLELTESILVHDADGALARLQALARIGVKLAIDDFGTGYSSLAYLKRFPIDRLKIDRSFVQGLPGTDSDAAIVTAILQMAAALGLRVIAEGVETEAQRDFLLRRGCHAYQGWLHAPALDRLSFEKRLRQAQPLPMPAPHGIALAAG
ncbi:MAG TPA: EAL domain-containing protein [Rubrivivax sp.]|nr:EAL domain-containing protein [Rubrivivax sp.]